MYKKFIDVFKNKEPLIDPMELEQAKIRIFVGLVILIYLVYRNSAVFFSGEQRIAHVEVVAFLIDFIFLSVSVLHLFAILGDYFTAKARRIFGALLDQGTTTIFMLQAGEAGFMVIGIYLWVAFGNGFRFGKPYLYFAQVLSIIGFTITTNINPYWFEHKPIVFSIFLMLIALPIYVATLINRLNEAKKYAERASELKTQFVAVMSHEIRTPLNGIVGISTLLKTSPLNLEQKELITTLDSSSKQLLGILNNVLDFAKIEEDKLTIENKPFSLAGLVNDTQSAFAKVAEIKHLSFSTGVESHELNLVGDVHKLQQVITNLVGNAIKFTERGSVMFSVKTLDISSEACSLRFEVVDTGIGIPEDKQQSIFDSFTQADASTTRRFGGSGLGLTISKHIIEQMGGVIECDSKEGIGTRFWFDLNFVLASQNSLDTTSKPSLTLAEARQAMRKLKVLICEDDATNQKILQKLLELLEYEISVVDSADDMLDLLEVSSFDLVISDLNMAGMTGIDAIKSYRFIKPDDKQTKFILFTADATVATKKEASNAGFDAFLSKPVDADTLFATIAHLFDMPLVTTEMLSQAYGDIVDMGSLTSIEDDEILNQSILKELELLGGTDPLFVHRLLKNYLVDSEQLVEKITRAVEEKRYADAQEHCHALRGNSLSVGAQKVYERTDAIEKAAPSVLRFRGASMTGQLRADFEAVRTSVEHYLSQRQVASR